MSGVNAISTQPRTQAQVATEVNDAPLVASYTALQADRLGAFRNILRTVYAQHEPVRVGKPRLFGRYEGETLVEPYMRLDGRFLYTWNHVAESMYQSDFAHDPTLKDAAQDIVTQVKPEFDGPAAMSADELRALVER